MKAAVFQEPGTPLLIENVPDPQPGPGEMVIAVGACGICGTDLHWTENRDTQGGWRELKRGCVLGHEFAGEVVEVGHDAKGDFNVGDSVCALPFIGCGQCPACLSGRIYRCANAHTRASETLTGAYAEFTRIGRAEAIRLPPGTSHGIGALVEPLAVGLAATERARFAPGDSVLIMGAGPVGLSVAMWCRFLGARHVVVSDVVRTRAERATDFGATDCIDASSESVVDRMRNISGGPPSVVIECVGVPGTLQKALEYVAPDGVVVVAGLCMGVDTFSPAIAVVKAVDLRFTMCYEKRHFETIVDHLESGRIEPSKLITGTVGFAAFSQRFEALKSAGSDLKVMLNPSLM
ncbi:MAG: alcohol dehydrogenase catalytic domain-containing protein [Chromatiales bacterium]|jgi:(R,R)-butanediol dehydrogenase / meso-butanediol dehydrogenase / diacetyl reductase|nr:alcohol dehydrogenase catalytic domain-containing protein [Chromatiales bacterium]